MNFSFSLTGESRRKTANIIARMLNILLQLFNCGKCLQIISTMERMYFTNDSNEGDSLASFFQAERVKKSAFGVHFVLNKERIVFYL